MRHHKKDKNKKTLAHIYVQTAKKSVFLANAKDARNFPEQFLGDTCRTTIYKDIFLQANWRVGTFWNGMGCNLVQPIWDSLH